MTHHDDRGRERYPVNIRYARELRDTVDKLKRVLVPVMSGAGGGGKRDPWGRSLPIRSPQPAIRNPSGSRWASSRILRSSAARRPSRARKGCSRIRVRGLLGRDVGGYVEEAKKKVAKR